MWSPICDYLPTLSGIPWADELEYKRCIDNLSSDVACQMYSLTEEARDSMLEQYKKNMEEEHKKYIEGELINCMGFFQRRKYLRFKKSLGLGKYDPIV